jgi:hypothetical protein
MGSAQTTRRGIDVWLNEQKRPVMLGAALADPLVRGIEA